jgi:hypothetical protein
MEEVELEAQLLVKEREVGSLPSSHCFFSAFNQGT